MTKSSCWFVSSGVRMRLQKCRQADFIPRGRAVSHVSMFDGSLAVASYFMDGQSHKIWF